MAKEITYLIDLINKEKGKPTLSISSQKFGSFLRRGIKTEPEKFPQLIEAFEANIRAAFPDWPAEQVKARNLGNIAALALIADRGLNRVILQGIASGYKHPGFWYDHPEEYGKAMSALTDYVGVKGPALRSVIPDLNTR